MRPYLPLTQNGSNQKLLNRISCPRNQINAAKWKNADRWEVFPGAQNPAPYDHRSSLIDRYVERVP